VPLFQLGLLIRFVPGDRFFHVDLLQSLDQLTHGRHQSRLLAALIFYGQGKEPANLFVIAQVLASGAQQGDKLVLLVLNHGHPAENARSFAHRACRGNKTTLLQVG
jgi:hypothetical protein